MRPIIDIRCSEYLAGDEDADTFVEFFKDIRVFGLLLYRKVEQSTDNSKIQKYCETKRKPIGF